MMKQSLNSNFKICFVIPYFGKLPASFSAWLSSAKYNKDVDFLIFTDNQQPTDIPINIKWHIMNWQKMKMLIDNTVGFKTNVRNPYKLCDVRPAYGDVFCEYIKDYDFWGFCDIDIIFGRIRDFITDEILENYDKVGELGHCVLLRNTPFIRKLYKKPCYGEDDLYKTVFGIRSNFSFDEGNGKYGFPTMCFENNIRTYCGGWFIDLKVDDFEFTYNDGNVGGGQKIDYIHFCNGQLKAYDVRGGDVEVLYVHFQTRKMRNLIQSKYANEFFAIPNCISETRILNYEQRMEDYNLFYKNQKKNKLNSKKKRIIKGLELLLRGKVYTAEWRRLIFGKSR